VGQSTCLGGSKYVPRWVKVRASVGQSTCHRESNHVLRWITYGGSNYVPQERFERAFLWLELGMLTTDARSV
jgi:hypothetical protein